MNKKAVRRRVLNFIGSFNSKTKTKFENIGGKTGQYNVPIELFQKRTARKNRVLISWKSVKKNNLTLEYLNAFEGGIVVEFINEDYFEELNQNDPLFIQLRERLGSDDRVSSMISIRTETGSSSSSVPRENYKKLIDNTEVEYNGEKLVINEDNLSDYYIRRKQSNVRVKNINMGNDKWEGFIFVSIRGGQQDSIESHAVHIPLFNPACEYTNENVGIDLELTMSYFALKSMTYDNFSEAHKLNYRSVLGELETCLRESYYDSEVFKGNLLEYCENHPSIAMHHGYLYDPIQVEEIKFEDFSIDNKQDPRNIDFTHDEAINKDTYYWDTAQNTILTAARPMNIFWSKHLSNMMQQNFSLNEYFKHEEIIVQRRRDLLK